MDPIRFVRRLLSSALVSSCLIGAAALAAAAASAPAGKAAAKAPAKPASAAAARTAKAASAPGARSFLLTPAELRDCKQQEADVQAFGEQAKVEKAALEAEKGEIVSSGTDLGTAIATLDKSDPGAVDAYNAKVAARDARIDAYQGRVGAFNQKAEAVNARRDAYAAKCDKRTYDERDLADNKRKK